MYQKKIWKPTEQQKKAIEEILTTPWFLAICEKAEYEFSEAGKFLLTLTQQLNTRDDNDLLTLEKEWISAWAVYDFLESVKRYWKDYIGESK